MHGKLPRFSRTITIYKSAGITPGKNRTIPIRTQTPKNARPASYTIHQRMFSTISYQTIFR
jgi:hypothetical protein